MRNIIGVFFIMQVFVGCNAQPTGISANSIYKNISKGNTVDIVNASFSEEVNISASNIVKTSVAKDVSCIGSVLVFKDCIFSGGFTAYTSSGSNTHTTYFKDMVVFVNCTFDTTVNFRHCVFEKELQFQQCKFTKLANFEECTFGAEASFLNCSFVGEARFQGVLFSGKCSFMDSKFLNTVSFQNSRFSSNALFGNAEFSAYADYSAATFNGFANFTYAKFYDRGDFTQAQFKGRMDANNTKLGNMNFTDALFYGITRFNNTSIDAKLNLSGCYFMMQPQFEQADLGKIDMATAKVAEAKALEPQ